MFAPGCFGGGELHIIPMKLLNHHEMLAALALIGFPFASSFSLHADLVTDPIAAPPPPQTVIDTFDTEESAAGWTATWGTSPRISWDSQDANGSANSGSLKVTADYFTPEGNGWEQMVITRTFPNPVLGTDHVSVSIDVKIGDDSVPNSDGNYGYFELKRTSNGTPLGGVNLTSKEWTTIGMTS